MQANSVIPVVFPDDPYNSDMAGRPPTKPAPPFGERLAALRKARGWTQPQLAERLDLTVKTITYYERLAGNPTAKTIERLAQVFGVSYAELLGDPNGQKQTRKSGPPSRLQQLTGEVSELPRNKQKFVIEFLEGYLQRAAHGHKQAA
jgi:transcriptional regulator with XRE-family HTH domain